MNVSIKQADPGIQDSMTKSHKKSLATRMCGLMLTALAVTGAGNAMAADVYLKASAFAKTMTDGSTVKMWGFESCTGTDGTTLTGCTGTPSTPGPQINAVSTEALNIHVQNSLSVPVSVMVPGQLTTGDGAPASITDTRLRSRATSMTAETAAGAISTYTIASPKEGTYLYQSGSAPQLQVPMGLYGALVVTGTAYPTTTTSSVILFSEIDAEQNARVQAAATAGMTMGPSCLSKAKYADPTSTDYRAVAYPCTIDYKPRHLLVNGGSGFELTAATGDTVLLRYLNAGQKMHTPSIVGLEQDVIAEDGNLYPGVPTRVPRVQSVIMLPPNGTKDAVATLTENNVKLSLFDRQPGFRNDSESVETLTDTGTGGSLGGITIGTPAAAVLAAMHVVDDEYSTPEDTALTTEDVSSNDTVVDRPLYDITVQPQHGTVTLSGTVTVEGKHPTGAFVYTPDANYSGVDSFQYSVCTGTTGPFASRVCGGPAEVGVVVINVSYVNDAPVANDDTIPVNGTGSSIVFTAADILANDTDADGDTLHIDAATLGALAGLAYDAGTNTFTYTGTGGTFTYVACDPATPSLCSTAATVTLPTSMAASNISLIVEDTTTDPVTTLAGYQWTVEEDITYHPDPTSPPSTDVLALGFHKSYMPVIAQGRGAAEFAALALDPAKHYYVSVLPDDNGNKDDPGHATGGAMFMGNATEVRVDVYPTPTSPAQISIKVFNDNAPTNGAWDTGEVGLGGFAVTIEDGGGRYGLASGMVNYDMDGLPLTNALDCFGTFTTNPDGTFNYTSVPAKPGVIITCPDNAYTRSLDIAGEALVKNVYPAKYGIIVTPPEGQVADWVQTSTIEGTKVNDVWVKAGEPAYFQEFGPPGWHNFTGFVRPADLDNNGTPDNFLTGSNSVTGMVTNAHISRPPIQTIYDSGSYDALAHTRAWIAVNSGNGTGPTIAAKLAEEDGSFTFTGLPDGDYQLAIWDRYLDQVLAYKSFHVDAATPVFDAQHIPVFNWFGRHEHSVFQDDGGTCGPTSTAAQNGVWDNTDPDVNTTMVASAQNCNEAFMPDQNVNLRWRDGTIYASFPTDGSGYVPFDQVFPFFHWLIAEIDYARFKPTGVTVAVDHGGDVASQPAPFTGLLAPQQQLDPSLDDANVSTDPNWRTELGSTVLLEGYQQFLGQTSKFQWGKVEWPKGQNGGIAGIVYYATTRAENDPRLAAAEPWEPGIADAKVRLYKKVTTAPQYVVTQEPVSQPPQYLEQMGGYTDAGVLTAGHYTLDTNLHWNLEGLAVQGLYKQQFGVWDLDQFIVLAEKPIHTTMNEGQTDQRLHVSIADDNPYLGAPVSVRVVNLAPQGTTDEIRHLMTLSPESLVFINEVTTDNFDASVPTGCPGAAPEDAVILGEAPIGNTTTISTKCYDGMRNWNQVRPTVFDGGYAFNEDQDGNPLKPGAYVVEVEVPKGYQILKEEDVNVGFGESYARVPVDVVYPSGGTATVPGPEIVGDHQIGDVGIAQARCVGKMHTVPAYLSLYKDTGTPAAMEPAPFAGMQRPLCDRREVQLVDQAQANAEFWVFTPSPISGHGVGMILDDTAQEFNKYSPAFSEKWAPPYVPVSIRRGIDGKEIGRVVSDQYGRFNLNVPSTASADLPSSSGAAPAMVISCMNDPGPIPDPADPTHMIVDPNFNPSYSNFCYLLQYMPGTTTYLDTPVLPVAAFASGFSPPDCALNTGLTNGAGVSLGLPQISSVSGTGDGPLVAPGAALTITSVGTQQVPNPAYLGPLDPAGAPRLIPRDFGFGAQGPASQVTLNGTALTVTSWSNDQIVVQTPATAQVGQLMVTRADGKATEAGITVTVAPDETGVVRVAAGGSIQAAIDAANAGDMVLVAPGVYNERVIMYKPIKLQGSGLGTLINGVINPTQTLAGWREKIDCLFGVTAGCTKVIDELPGQGVGALGMLENEGATVSVFAPRTGANRFAGRQARIDGFSITGSSTAGGMFVNGWAHGLDITNNDVFGNSGGLHGGIRVGVPDLQQAAPAGSGADRNYGFNRNVHIRYNIVRQNGSVGVAGAGGVGGGVSIMAGSDNYRVTDNFVCGNFTMGDGAGVGHYGLSQGGRIARNDIVLNQSFEQTVNVSGGGIFVGGEPASIPLGTGESITAGSGSLEILNNLIQANQAGAGHGGGIRLQYVNGADVVTAADGTTATIRASVDQISIRSNKIVNNVAGWSGAGVSMLDAINVEMRNNTIVHNDTTATVGSLISIVGGVNSSTEQPSGVVAEMNSITAAGVTGLSNVIAAKPGGAGWGTFKTHQWSNARIFGGQILENRSFSYYADGTVGPELRPVMTQATVGACDASAHYMNLGVLNTTNVFTTVTADLTSDPSALFADAYCNGGRAAPGPIDVFPAVDEAGAAWIDVRFGPLSVFGDYSTP